MNNKEIAKSFKLLSELMELHGENPFKIRAYTNAYQILRKFEQDLKTMTVSEIEKLPNLNKSTAEKALQLALHDELDILNEYKKKTPPGIIDMLNIRGLGPKKVLSIWKEMDVLDIQDLLLACNENRLVAFKGFGIKTQEEIKNKIEFYQASSGKYLCHYVYPIAIELVDKIAALYPQELTSLTGQIRRKCSIVDGIQLITTVDSALLKNLMDQNKDGSEIWMYKDVNVTIHQSNKADFWRDLFSKSASDEFLEKIGNISLGTTFQSEEEIFQNQNASFVHPEYRETSFAAAQAKENKCPNLIEVTDIKGVVHTHTKYSDGLHAIAEMATHSHNLGYEYIVITDHSKSAFYANGLSIERVEMQWKEIDDLNKSNKSPCYIFKGIESDILNDGSLDYPDDILASFDLVIASIHANLNMDKEKATTRLIKAIENPYTSMLGHPTGRLLLGRRGYEIDHKKIIDSCSQNNVHIEINANPQRLDIDWTWIPYCIEKNVLISINPDAHSKGQIAYISAGIDAARKGGLTKEMCINTFSKEDFKNKSK
jgi:DNA polymerase (family X)